MKKEVTITAASVDKAIEMALEELGVQQLEVEIEVLEEPAKKLFGGVTNAKVKVSLKAALQEEEAAGGLEDDEEPDEAEAEDEDEPEEEGFSDTAAGKRQYFSDEDEVDFNKTNKPLTDDELDTIADSAIETIREFLVHFGVEDAEIDEYEGDDGELILDIVGDNLAVLIGRHGKTIDAIQFLVSSIVAKKTGYRHPVVIDVKGYKHRRKQKIVGIARASAARAIRQKHDVRLRPMTPFERRIVHIALREDKRVTTISEGTEPNRYVIIKLK